MSAEAKPTVTPPPVFARRQPKPQYLAPGQHLKVASRRPPAKSVPAGPQVPRDPWEALDEDAISSDNEEGNFPYNSYNNNSTNNSSARAPKAPSPPPASASASSGLGGRSPPLRTPPAQAPHDHRSPDHHTPRGTGGHPFSAHLSRSRSSANSEAADAHPLDNTDNGGGRPEVSAAKPAVVPLLGGYRRVTSHKVSSPAAPAVKAEEADKPPHVVEGEEEVEEEENYYSNYADTPELTAAERAQRVLEMQHQALEVKQIKKLTEQGIARRPKTLVRNRHGRLQAIAAEPHDPASTSSSTDGAALQIADAPMTMKAKPRPGVRGSRAANTGSAAATAPRSQGKTPASAPPPPPPPAASRVGDDLVNSRPSTPRLDIELDD